MRISERLKRWITAVVITTICLIALIVIFTNPLSTKVDAQSPRVFQVQRSEDIDQGNSWGVFRLTRICDTDTGNLLYVTDKGGQSVVENGCQKKPR